jgi:hypothetical protein
MIMLDFIVSSLLQCGILAKQTTAEFETHMRLMTNRNRVATWSPHA